MKNIIFITEAQAGSCSIFYSTKFVMLFIFHFCLILISSKRGADTAAFKKNKKTSWSYEKGASSFLLRKNKGQALFIY
jgi:hypothetical protein